MKNVFVSLVIFVSLLLVSCSSNSVKETAETKDTAPVKVEASNLIIPYGEYKGMPVELEYDSIKQRLSIRVAMEDISFGDEELNFLKEEVMKIFIPGELKIAKTNYTLHCAGGYPLWGPYSSTSNGVYHYYKCLLFSENVTLLSDDIYLSGIDRKSSYYPYLPEIPVGEKNFEKLVNFIQNKGFAVPQRGISCDYQYTFLDTDGNRHALITIKRDKDGNPSMQGVVNHISVWAY